MAAGVAAAETAAAVKVEAVKEAMTAARKAVAEIEVAGLAREEAWVAGALETAVAATAGASVVAIVVAVATAEATGVGRAEDLALEARAVEVCGTPGNLGSRTSYTSPATGPACACRMGRMAFGVAAAAMAAAVGAMAAANGEAAAAEAAGVAAAAAAVRAKEAADWTEAAREAAAVAQGGRAATAARPVAAVV